ncbi:MAG: transporter ATP-binding protein [Microbacteriaceae bacterium]|nr:transporter ATP-binding protein [Microbacteriaceae bacterium]
MTALLEVRGLDVRFAGAAASVVKDVSFDVQPGECIGIVGESGSGKSVTARAVLGLASRTATVRAETLRFDGTDLQAASPRLLRQLRGKEIGFVSQGALVALDPLRTVGREIGDALRLHTDLSPTERRARVLELLAEVGVPEPRVRADQRADQLSGGLRQRAIIASAIALRPRLLIADEPTTALDSTVQAGILDLLESLRAQGTALVLISHDLAVVSRLASTVLVMRGGTVVESGNTARVLGDPQHDYTRQLIAAVPTDRPRGTRLGAAPRPAALSPGAPTAAASSGNSGVMPATIAFEAETPVRPSLTPEFAKDAPFDGATTPAETTDATADVVLEASGLVRRFGSRTAVDDVGFVLRRGRTLGVVGESGSGKTTVARLVLALERADSGTVRVLGERWSESTERERRRLRPRIGAIYQDALSSFDPRWTVGQIIEDALTRGRSRRAGEDAAHLLDRVGLGPELLGRRPRLLSGGQQQRVAIARAIAPRPDIIVCDEPVSSLDVSVQAQVLDLLDDLQASLGISYLFISHDLGVIRHVSDDVLVMRAGAVVEGGNTESVFLRPSHEYTRALLDSAPRLPARAAAT